jgi:CheY-like chemotaxis protein
MDKFLRGRRVLVVEDEMLILMMTEDMLSDLGCEDVVTAATVRQALAVIEGQFFDAAMLDMNLNGDNTHTVADALAVRGVPFAFATGYSDNVMRIGDRDRPLLKKPFQDEQLAEVFRRLLPNANLHPA